MKSLNLKAKFLIPTLILVLLGLGTITVFSSWGARNTLVDILERDAQEVTKALSGNVSNWIASIKRDAATWSTRHEFLDYESTEAFDSLTRLNKANPLYVGISLLNQEGLLICSTTPGAAQNLNLADRDYVKTAMRGEVGLSDLNLSRVTGLPLVAVAAPIIKNSSVIGVLFCTVNIPALTDYFFKGIDTGKGGYIMMFNSKGGFLSHPQIEEMGKLQTTPHYVTQMLEAKNGILEFKTDTGEDYIAAFTSEPQLGWVIAACYQADELYANLSKRELVSVATGVGVLLITALLIYLLVRSITTPLQKTVKVINELSQGEGDLTARLEATSRDEVGQLALALNIFIEKLWDLVSQIKTGSISINTLATEMNKNNSEINERTQQQASALEETSSALEQMTGSVQNNAASALEASRKANQTFEMAQQGGKTLNETMYSMKQVTEASSKINEIVNVVNEIAFQTNLLALNAAVEAARAGEAGKGFAVVAGEVRSLAGRSADASKEIQTLITDSVNKIQASNQSVLNSDEILKSIITSIQQANDTISEITSASQEQSSGIGEISNAVQHMDQGVQRNSQMVSDNFDLSKQLSESAQDLVDLVSKFKL